MAIIKCRECNNPVSNQAEKCPNCGVTIKKPAGCGTVIAVVVLFFIAFSGFMTAFETKQPQPEKTPEQIRRELIEKPFDLFDGSHDDLTRNIKASLNDPDSYQHDKTTYKDMTDHLIITTTFRAKNKYGGMMTYQVIAKADLNGKVLEITSFKPVTKY